MPVLISIASADQAPGQQFSPILTSVQDEKYQVFRSLLIYCSTLEARFAPYVSQSLEITILTLRLHSHDVIQKTCTSLVPKLLACAMENGVFSVQTISTIILQLIHCIGSETNLAFLQPLLKCYQHSIKAIGGPVSLPRELNSSFVEAIRHQINTIADIRSDRSRRHHLEPAGGAMLTTVDLEHMQAEPAETRTLDGVEELLRFLDMQHPLLESVSNVRGMGQRVNDAVTNSSIGSLKELFPGIL